MIRVILINCYVACILQLAFTQTIQDENALKLISELENKYNAYKSLEASFRLTTEIPEEDPIIESGKFIQSGDAYHLNSDQQQIYSDGRSIWLFQRRLNEVQINSIDEGDGSMISLTPKGIIALFNDKDFDYAVVNEENGFSYVEFKPLDRDSDYHKARLAIDLNKRELTNAKVFYKDGIHLSLDVINMIPNQTYDAEIFVFDAAQYPDVHVEDLRID